MIQLQIALCTKQPEHRLVSAWCLLGTTVCWHEEPLQKTLRFALHTFPDLILGQVLAVRSVVPLTAQKTLQEVNDRASSVNCGEAVSHPDPDASSLLIHLVSR